HFDTAAGQRGGEILQHTHAGDARWVRLSGSTPPVMQSQQPPSQPGLSHSRLRRRRWPATSSMARCPEPAALRGGAGSSRERSRPVIGGRTEEVGALDGYLADRQAQPCALLIDGEPGIGKTTLLRELLTRAAERGYAVLSCRPTRSEMDLSYAGLVEL